MLQRAGCVGTGGEPEERAPLQDRARLPTALGPRSAAIPARACPSRGRRALSNEPLNQSPVLLILRANFPVIFDRRKLRFPRGERSAKENSPMTAPLMPKATAVWLVENTALSFDQI